MNTISWPRALILKMEPNEISDYSLGLEVARVRGRVAVIPNSLANLLSEFHVSLGLTSKILPKRGTPGGPGILVGIVAGAKTMGDITSIQNQISKSQRGKELQALGGRGKES